MQVPEGHTQLDGTVRADGAVTGLVIQEGDRGGSFQINLATAEWKQEPLPEPEPEEVEGPPAGWWTGQLRPGAGSGDDSAFDMEFALGDDDAPALD